MNIRTMSYSDLDITASELVPPGKGILAADESGPTIEKRFRDIGLKSTEETRRAYREILFNTPGLAAFISGVILYDETIRQHAADGTPFAEVLTRQGIIPGIKVDRGAKPLAGFPGEKVTEGLDGLRERLLDYRKMGARFAKWRAVFQVGPGIPSPQGLEANAHALARYAALCQEAGLVPIVEPEVLMDGDHSIERHAEVTTLALQTVFNQLDAYRVRLEGMLLKPNMVLAGSECVNPAPVARVAEETIRCMRDCVPAAVPGLIFLSGGQDDVSATEHLDAMNRIGHTPWELSFSFGRALQAPVLRAWGGQSRNVAAAHEALMHRARCNSAARFGQYSADMELLE